MAHTRCSWSIYPTTSSPSDLFGSIADGISFVWFSCKHSVSFAIRASDHSVCLGAAVLSPQLWSIMQLNHSVASASLAVIKSTFKVHSSIKIHHTRRLSFGKFSRVGLPVAANLPLTSHSFTSQSPSLIFRTCSMSRSHSSRMASV